MASWNRTRLARVALIFGVWALLGAVALGNSWLSHNAAECDVVGAGKPPGPFDALPGLARDLLPPYLFWALLTPFILLLAARRPLERLREPGVAAQHLGALAVAVLASAAFKDFAHNFMVHTVALRPDPAWHLSVEQMRNFLHQSLPVDVFTYGGILAVGVAFSYYRASRERQTEAARLQTHLAEARFETLRAKVEPHFLFNTLNTISALAERDPAATRETVASLSALLRRALDHSAASEVPLQEELAFSQHYLEIERRRYGSRLHVELAIERTAESALVPSFVLQPLLENSIRHGTSRKRGHSVIRVEAHAEEGCLVLRVRDNGRGLDGELCEGIGLRSTRARLEELYGEAAALEAGNGSDGGGFEVVARMPLRLPDPDAYAAATAAADAETSLLDRGREAPAGA